MPYPGPSDNRPSWYVVLVRTPLAGCGAHAGVLSTGRHFHPWGQRILMSGCMTARRCAKVLAWGVPGFLASMLWGEAWHYRMASFATWNLCCNFRSRSKSKDSVEVFRVARWLIRLSVKQRYPRLFKGGIAQTWWISIVARQVEGRFRWYHHTGYSHPGLRANANITNNWWGNPDVGT